MAGKQQWPARIILRCLLICLIVTTTPAYAGFADDPGRSPLAAVRIVEGRLIAGDQPFHIRGLNYTHPSGSPAACPELHFGADGNCPWDMAAIEADMARFAALGVNTVRIFLNYYVFGGARSSNPDYRSEEALRNLDDLIAAANRRGIYVLPVLLAKYPQDQIGNPAAQAEALSLHVEPLVQHLAGRPGILAWDLFNEPDIGSPIDARCWDWDNGDFPLCRSLAIERSAFLGAVEQSVRRDDPNRLITIGMGFAKSYHRPSVVGTALAAMVDFYSFHYYDNDPYDSGRYREHWYYGRGFPADLEQALDELRTLTPPKPVLVSELGFPDGPQALRDSAAVQRDLQHSLRVLDAANAAGVLFWPFEMSAELLIGERFRAPLIDIGGSTAVREPQLE